MARHKRTFHRHEFLSYRKKGTFFIYLIFGFFAGFLSSYFAQLLFLSAPMAKISCRRPRIHREPRIHGEPETRDAPTMEVSGSRLENLTADISDNKRFLLVSVMTADQFLDSRAQSIHSTWGKTIDSGLVIYFTGDKGNTTHNLTVVKLPGVDDGYPPQRKSFYMLKYLYDHYIDDFHWFVRADDDVYIRTERLSALLRRLPDSSEDILIGHSGIGKPHEKGKLGLQEEDNFCLGGPGVVMSQSVLRKLGPHLMTCLNATITSHEDTELGRCIRRHVGVICPWAQETRNLFHQIFENPDSLFSGSVDKKGIRFAITVHPVKKPSHMHLLHRLFLSQTVQHLALRSAQLHQNRERITELLLTRTNKGFQKVNFYGRLLRNSSSPWECFTLKDLYGLRDSAVGWVSGGTSQALRRVLGGAMKHVNAEAAKQLIRPEEFKKLNLGAMRTSATQGLQFTLDFNTLLKPSVPDSVQIPRYSHHYVHFQESFAPLLTRTIESDEMSQLVHFIVPLTGRFQTFQRFLKSFEKAFISQGKQVVLLIIYFPDVFSPKPHKKVFEAFRAKYPTVILNWLELAGEFSRARALELGTKCCGDDALLFFSDVDFIFSTEFYDRCRVNTLPGERVYFPIFFSQFNPHVVYHNQSRPPSDNRVYTKRAGTWRKHSYGPVCVYASDVKAVGGLNTSIRGWGLEDLDFYEKCLTYKYDVLRAPDLGLLHIYHPQTNCLDPRLNAEQAKMCQDSRLNGLASAESLVDYLQLKDYV